MDYQAAFIRFKLKLVIALAEIKNNSARFDQDISLNFHFLIRNMTDKNFQTYNASAGAGKTYSLVRNYLKICLRSKNANAFRSILAITFTNKAAQEMKERIIRALTAFSDYPNCGKDAGMFEDLVLELKLQAQELQNRSQEVLRQILHQYSAFSVSTIDKFTNRLIRTFAQDLKLSVNYEVELDGEKILEEAIDKMLSGLKEDKALAKILIQYLNSQLEEGKSPRTEKPLLTMAYNLFRENSIPAIKSIQNISNQDFINIRQKLIARNIEIEENLQERAQNTLNFLEDNAIPHDLFSRSSIPKYLIKCLKDKPQLPSKTILKQINGESALYPAKSKKQGEILIDPIEPKLLEMLQEILNFLEENYTVYSISKMILSNIMGMAVLKEIENNLEEIKKDSNRLPIGEFNKLVSDKLQDQPAAFLYERIGDKYQNYFIDEFQDTSLLQWHNMRPLVNNAMSQGGSTMLVGDAKQAIYRWRGGEVEQFLNLSDNTDKGNKIKTSTKEIELYQRETIRLPFNWRSKQRIVDFNNSFFQSILAAKSKEGEQLLTNQSHRKIFEQSSQKVKGSDGGFVSLKRLPYATDEKEAFELNQSEEVLEIIENAKKRGYSLSDIAVLTRGKKQGAIISNHLINNDIDIISPDSLSLGQSPEVNAFISFLQLFLRPDDKESALSFWNWWYEKKSIENPNEERHAFLKYHTKLVENGLIDCLEKELEHFKAKKWFGSSLTEKTYGFCQIFNVPYQNDPFLQSLLDVIHKYECNEDHGETGFIRWWENQGIGYLVDLPEDMNAVSMMTIHKSKGLEFPIVILAFADWKAFSEMDSDAWLLLPEEDYFGLPLAKVGLKKEESELEGMQHYREVYDENKENIVLDNLNLLYVALTRPKDELYIIGSVGRSDESGRISAYLSHFQEGNGLDVSTTYESGEKGENQEMKSGKARELISYEMEKGAGKVKTAVDAPKDWKKGESSATIWGKKVHQVLSNVKTIEDIENELDALNKKGSLEESEIQKIEQMVNAVVQHPKLKDHFARGAEVLNEIEILIPQSKSLQPDRIVLQDGHFYIMEYKTGKAYPSHADQVLAYADVLLQMGFEKGGSFLIYLEEEIKVLEL